MVRLIEGGMWRDRWEVVHTVELQSFLTIGLASFLCLGSCTTEHPVEIALYDIRVTRSTPKADHLSTSSRDFAMKWRTSRLPLTSFCNKEACTTSDARDAIAFANGPLAPVSYLLRSRPRRWRLRCP